MNAPRIGNAISALNALRQRELDSRRQAVTILQPSEVAGKLFPARMLTTRLGGAGARLITPADLAHFKREVEALGDKARRGLTAKEALGLSRTADVERAKAQIRYSMPVRLQADKVHLVTDSGPDVATGEPGVSILFRVWITSADLHDPGAPDLGPGAVRNGALAPIDDHPRRGLIVQVISEADDEESAQ